MIDNISMKKVYEDQDLIELEVLCKCSVASIASKIYTSEEMIDELSCKIKQILQDDVQQTEWSNGKRGNDTLPCVEFRVFKKDKFGHIVIEVFAELDDGGDYDRHNCCFFINTEYGLLMNFGERLSGIKNEPIGFLISLNTP